MFARLTRTTGDAIRFNMSRCLYYDQARWPGTDSKMTRLVLGVSGKNERFVAVSETPEEIDAILALGGKLPQSSDGAHVSPWEREKRRMELPAWTSETVAPAQTRYLAFHRATGLTVVRNQVSRAEVVRVMDQILAHSLRTDNDLIVWTWDFGRNLWVDDVGNAHPAGAVPGVRGNSAAGSEEPSPGGSSSPRGNTDAEVVRSSQEGGIPPPPERAHHDRRI